MRKARFALVEAELVHTHAVHTLGVHFGGVGFQHIARLNLGIEHKSANGRDHQETFKSVQRYLAGQGVSGAQDKAVNHFTHAGSMHATALHAAQRFASDPQKVRAMARAARLTRMHTHQKRVDEERADAHAENYADGESRSLEASTCRSRQGTQRHAASFVNIEPAPFPAPRAPQCSNGLPTESHNQVLQARQASELPASGLDEIHDSNFNFSFVAKEDVVATAVTAAAAAKAANVEQRSSRSDIEA